MQELTPTSITCSSFQTDKNQQNGRSFTIFPSNREGRLFWKGVKMSLEQRALHHAVGMSDMASLLAAAFRFPQDDEFACALADGSFLADWRASIEDACDVVSDDDKELIGRCTSVFSEAKQDELRKEFSRLFLSPGVEVPVWPYESAFRHRAMGAPGVPSLFRSRITLDVERQMEELGVRFSNDRSEPADSAFVELEFLAFLHAGEAEAIRSDADAGLWRSRISSFAEDHALMWLPAFMEDCVIQSRIGAYRCLAELGQRYLEELRADAKRPQA